MKSLKTTRCLGLLLSLTLLASLNLGCTTTSLFKPGAGDAAEGTIVGDKFYTIQVKSDWGNNRTVKEALPRPVPLQEALEKANAIPNFGSIEVTIYRVVPETGKTLVMTAEFDSEKDQIVTHQNYDIRPNDHIKVQPASGSALDSLTSPLTKMVGG